MIQVMRPSNGNPPYDAQAAAPQQKNSTLGPNEVAFLVVVPPNATVWINGAKTAQTGPEREFTSSDLTPGQSYTYTVRATWTAPNGQPFDQTRQLNVVGGEKRVVDFFGPPH